MNEIFSRTELILGSPHVEKLHKTRVAVFGLGGVGSYAAESLVRSGIGTVHLIDNDIVCESNINRQICALHSTIGKQKTAVMKERMLDINPALSVYTYDTFVLPQEDGYIHGDFLNVDFIIDAVDTVSAKIALALSAQNLHIPIISAMGCANRIQSDLLRIADIFETSVCPLCRVMRRELKKRHLEKLPVVFSTEPAIQAQQMEPVSREAPLGSVSWVPSAAGLMLSGFVIRSLIK